MLIYALQSFTATDGTVCTAKNTYTLTDAAGQIAIMKGHAQRAESPAFYGDVYAHNTGGTSNGAVLVTSSSGSQAIANTDNTQILFSDSIDPRTYGCKGDGQLVLDANVTLVSGTTYNIASATANGGAGFTTADIGKLVSVMNRNTAATADNTKGGTIAAIVNGNQAQVNLGGAPGGTLTNMRCVFGTDDTANLITAIAAAASKKAAVHISKTYCVSTLGTLPDDVNFFGDGPDQKRTWPFDVPYNGGAIVCATWPGTGVAMMVAGFGNGFYNLTLDGFGNCDKATLDTLSGSGKCVISHCMILSGYSNNVLLGATCNLSSSALWAHRCCLQSNLMVSGGDNRVTDCDIAGSGNNKYQIEVRASEVQINNVHSWKDSSMTAGSRLNGGQILIQPQADKFYGVDINNCIFDTSAGASYAHVVIDLSNGSVTNAYDISINGCRAFQNASSGAMPYIKLSVPVGKALRGFTVSNIKGMANFSVTEASQYTYLVDGSGVAGNVYASVTGGCNVMDCAALYNFSATWTRWDVDKGNSVLPTYAGTAATLSSPTTLGTYTFATLPAGIAAGTRAYVSDSNTAVFGATVAAGGANYIPAWFNGTNWIVG